MSLSSINGERRRLKRFKVVDGAFTVNSTKPGLIVDVSMEGLSFRYVDRKKWPNHSEELDILVGDYEFYLPQIPYTIVSDTVTASDSPDSSFIVKRCSVKFGDLSSSQKRKLEFFIENNTYYEEENVQMFVSA